MKLPPGWSTTSDGKRISITVKTADFLDALDLFEEIGEVAEELEHHPDLHLESYNRVRVESYSHDEGKVTDRDERLAHRVDIILRERGLI